MGISRIKPAELSVAAASLLSSLQRQADFSNVSAGQRLAKRSLDRYYATVEDDIFDLTLCNSRLEMAIKDKNEFSAEKYREEFVGRVFSLSLWGGLEPDMFEIMPIVNDGVDYTTREEFIDELSRSLAYHATQCRKTSFCSSVEPDDPYDDSYDDTLGDE